MKTYLDIYDVKRAQEHNATSPKLQKHLFFLFFSLFSKNSRNSRQLKQLTLSKTRQVEVVTCPKLVS